MAAIALVPREAIHVDDLERYDEFMKTIAGNEFLNFYPHEQVIKLDIHLYPSNKIVRSGEFKPGPDADAYFQEDAELVKQFLAQKESGKCVMEPIEG
ncbi:hypothetical protein FBEOM_3318 [Fusarium beomiforme]|uniref:Uncharacterized protein n=1 Tax=Fusarium beomiforme TaxID=44412 RepID=A0A9P5E1J6_9HYPO|nr:hypothetical protein FBEOM_3318 [Fusarium beomiforme]